MGRTACTRPQCLYKRALYLYPMEQVLLEKLQGSQLVKKFPTLHGPEGSLLHLQAPAIRPYPETDQSSPCTTSNFLKI